MWPTITVVVPTYKRPHLLNQCLNALFNQTLPYNAYEIIVVDDAPTKESRLLVEDYARRFSFGPSIRYVEVKGYHGPAAARNTGWRLANTPFIAFTDDDCQPSEVWLAKGLEALQDADAAWGKLVMPVSEQPTDYERDASHLTKAVFVTANCFCRRLTLERLKGFDERFRLAWREDADLYFKLLDHDSRIVHVPEAIVVHPVRPAPWGVSLSQQHKVLFDALLYKKHPLNYRSRIRACPLWNYYAIVISLLGLVAFTLAHQIAIAVVLGLIWLVLTVTFVIRRLRGTSHKLTHILEMLITSALIPPLALFWHWRGVFKFKTLYF